MIEQNSLDLNIFYFTMNGDIQSLREIMIIVTVFYLEMNLNNFFKIYFLHQNDLKSVKKINIKLKKLNFLKNILKIQKN